MKRALKDNHGLTLIELLVSIAILSVVVAAIMGFFIFSSGQYHSGNREASLSNESQLIVARLEDLIVNATAGVGTNKDPSGAVVETGDTLYVYSHETSKDGSSMVYKQIKIYPDTANQKLMYQSSIYTLDGEGTSTVTPETPEVIADYVDSFSVDLSNLKSNRAVTVTLGMKMKDKTYTTSNTYVLRNRVSDTISDKADDYFHDLAVKDPLTAVSKIEITPSSTSLWQGSVVSCPFSTLTTRGGVKRSDGNVIWSISGNTGSTAIDSATGQLIIDDAQTGTITVTATAASTVTGTGTPVTATATISVKSLTNLTIESFDKDTGIAVVKLTGANLSEEDLWTLSPSVTCGSLSTIVKERTYSSSVITYKIQVNKPKNFRGKTYPLTVSVKMNNAEKTDARVISFE